MIKKYLHFNLVLILLAFCLATTNIAQTAPSSLIDNGNSTVLATVGDIEITEDEFISGYEYGPSFYKRSAESKRKYIQYLINEKLLALKGYDEKIDTTEQVDEMYKEIINDLATEELFKEDILKPIQVTDSELDSVVTQKQIEIEMRWLYAEEFKEIHNYLNLLQNNISFDSLYAKQFSDSVSVDMRSLKTTRYLLGQKNPVLAKLIDTLRIGTYSSPIYSDEGWYIIKLNNVWNAILTNETELHKLKYESRQAIVKNKMDKASDLYVHNL
ncbi:MAG: peptidylprolyl isomerase, partial [Bacteroidetes bacterium]|nr:peptidylprolyl isomerase [Bacteroidota bacterium]